MSKDYRGERIVIYPAYLDKRLSRRLGRRVPLDIAVLSPRLEDIVRAARELGLDPIVDENSRYPRVWYRYRGRVIVLKKSRKQDILRDISKKINEYRRKRASH